MASLLQMGETEAQRRQAVCLAYPARSADTPPLPNLHANGLPRALMEPPIRRPEGAPPEVCPPSWSPYQPSGSERGLVPLGDQIAAIGPA